MKRRLVQISLALCLSFALLVTVTPVFAASSEAAVLQDIESVKNMVRQLNNLSVSEINSAKIIDAVQTTKTTNNNSDVLPIKMLKVTNQTKGMDTYYIPLVEDQNGNMVNAFTLAANGEITEDIHWTDIPSITVNVSVSHKEASFHLEGLGVLYNPKSIYVSWVGTDYSKLVTLLDGTMECIGDMYSISSRQLITRDRRCFFRVYKSYPTEGQAYGDWGAGLNDDYALYFSPAWHAGQGADATVHATILHNGVSNTYGYTWQLFGTKSP